MKNLFKNMTEKVSKGATDIILKSSKATAEKSVESCCFYNLYEPKIPEELLEDKD